jgi:hypothetical protein
MSENKLIKDLDASIKIVRDIESTQFPAVPTPDLLENFRKISVSRIFSDETSNTYISKLIKTNRKNRDDLQVILIAFVVSLTNADTSNEKDNTKMFGYLTKIKRANLVPKELIRVFKGILHLSNLNIQTLTPYVIKNYKNCLTWFINELLDNNSLVYIKLAPGEMVVKPPDPGYNMKDVSDLFKQTIAYIYGKYYLIANINTSENDYFKTIQQLLVTLVFDRNDIIKVDIAKKLLKEELYEKLQANSWKKVIDDAVSFTTLILNVNNEIPADEMTDYVKEKIENINTRFIKSIDDKNVNSYFDTTIFDKLDDIGLRKEICDKYDFIREIAADVRYEQFTPALYLAKAGPIYPHTMMIWLLLKNADFALSAYTKECIGLTTSPYCETIGNLSENMYKHPKTRMYIIKCVAMKNILQRLNQRGKEPEPVFSKDVDNILGENLTQWKKIRSSSYIRGYKCPREPWGYSKVENTERLKLKGCGIPGTSTRSRIIREPRRWALGRTVDPVKNNARLQQKIYAASALPGAMIIMGGGLLSTVVGAKVGLGIILFGALTIIPSFLIVFGGSAIIEATHGAIVSANAEYTPPPTDSYFMLAPYSDFRKGQEININGLTDDMKDSLRSLHDKNINKLKEMAKEIGEEQKALAEQNVRGAAGGGGGGRGGAVGGATRKRRASYYNYRRSFKNRK